MNAPITSPKVTGGGGFGFEDKVVAYYLACLLCHIPPFDFELGTISQISFQQKELGWFLDDIILTLVNGSVRRHVAISVKSNAQFTGRSAPQDFVEAAWSQFLGQGTSKFDPRSDYLALVTSPIAAATKNNLDTLLDWADKQDAGDMLGRLSSNGLKTKAALFRSFRCPGDLAASTGTTEKQIPSLLARVRHQQFDFEENVSNSTQTAYHLCRSALRSGDLQQAQTLWKSLQVIANEYRPAAGFLDLPKLVACLGKQFEFREFPHYEPDWQRLQAQTQTSIASVYDSIGGQVHIERQNDVARLMDNVRAQKTVVLLGTSGCGKSVIVKNWVQSLPAQATVLWWDAMDFDNCSLDREQSLGLQHPLEELFHNSTSAEGFVVIDRADRIHTDLALRNLSVLVRAAHADADNSRWHVLITCQPEDWDRIQTSLTRSNATHSPWYPQTLDQMSLRQLEPVWVAYPTLRPLSYQKELHPVLFNPKVLDLLATKSASGGMVDTTKWVGVSNLIDWFWSSEVLDKTNGVARANAMMELAERQGDTLTTAVPIRDLLQRSSYDELRNDRLCKVRENRVTFGHDLYGDWSRRQVILQMPSVLEYIGTKAGLPVWQRAIRLYGLYLLERHKIEEWHSLMQQFSASGASNPLALDLLLEAVIFAANPLPLLEAMWGDLCADNGRLLKRLLGRFLMLATLPNPWYVNYAKTVGANYEPVAVTKERYPDMPHWLRMLQFLHKHGEEACHLAPFHVAEIADTWLRRGGMDWPYRVECAKLALAIATEVLKEEAEGRSHGRNAEFIQSVYRAALAGIAELPEAVSAFALTASGRTPFENRTRIDWAANSDGEMGQLPPWPDGPSEIPDENFRDICLNSDAFFPFIDVVPQTAREVVLALLIERRHSSHSEFSFPIPMHGYGTSDLHQWYPPFYTRPPFLYFLRSYPVEAIDTIVRLVNFVTERWADEVEQNYGFRSKVEITVDGVEYIWIGDINLYFWYLGASGCPEAVVVALACLEKWLYEQLDAQQDIDSYLTQILLNSRSMALAGVLVAVGRKESRLLKAVLRPLLAIIELHVWEEPLNHGRFPRISSLCAIGRDTGAAQVAMAREWLSLPHRKVGLDAVSLDIFHTDMTMRGFFDALRWQWVERLANADEHSREILENYVALYDPDNWHPETLEGYQPILRFEPPENLRARHMALKEYLDNSFLTSVFPVKCRRYLDGELILPADQLERFWITLQQAAEVDSSQRADVSPRVDAICGGIAVLLCLHRSWLASNPGREKWCVNQLIATLEAPPEPYNFDSVRDSPDWYWHSFCAEAIPILWAEAVDDTVLRHAVVVLAMNQHHRTVELLFSASARVRNRLGAWFQQLQRFMLRWANQRTAMKRHRFFIFPPDESAWTSWLHAEMDNWQHTEVQPFIEGRIINSDLDWTCVEAKATWQTGNSYNHKRKRPRHAPLYDLELIKAAFSWLPSITLASTPHEREEIIHFWRQSLHCLLNMLEGDDDGRKIEGTPFRWDRWVLENIAKLLVELHPDERHEFFAPILRLGNSGNQWVKDFLRSFFLYNLDENIPSEEMMSAWEQMLNFASTCPIWWREAEKGMTFVSELWSDLLGMDDIWVERWTENRKVALARVKCYFELWAGQSLDNQQSVRLFVDTLKQPASESLLGDGLIWLESGTRALGCKFWESERNKLDDRLASLLALCWQSHRQIITKSPDIFKAFLNLLKQLADLQHPVAVELQRRVAQSSPV